MVDTKVKKLCSLDNDLKFSVNECAASVRSNQSFSALASTTRENDHIKASLR